MQMIAFRAYVFEAPLGIPPPNDQQRLGLERHDAPATSSLWFTFGSLLVHFWFTFAGKSRPEIHYTGFLR